MKLNKKDTMDSEEIAKLNSLINELVEIFKIIEKQPHQTSHGLNFSCMFHYPEKIDVKNSAYYRQRNFLIDYIKIKRLINDFLAKSFREEKPNVDYINNLGNLCFENFFFITVPMLDKTSIEQFLPEELKEIKDFLLDDNIAAPCLMNLCLGCLTERIKELNGEIPAYILYREFLMIVDATIDHFSMNQTMDILHFINMFLFPPKLMSEQWNSNYNSAICKYPWRAFELVCRLEDFMRGKKDKDALLYVHAAIEAGVVHREWKKFEKQYGTKYCSRKTYDKYTNPVQKYTYYTKEELDPLISFFKDYRPFWVQK